MKRILFIILLSCIVTGASAQTNSFIGVYGGGGLAATHNYDVALSGGFEFMKGLFNRTWLGVTAFYQSYGMIYDNEANGLKNGTGSAGVTVLNKSAYIFLAPKLTHDVGRNGFLKFYVNGGVGFNMGGTETMRKWDNTYGSSTGNYDSLLTTTTNINKMVVRFGLGFTENINMGKKWWFTVTEDFGFLPSSLSKTSDVNYVSRTSYSPSKLGPAYFSLQIGVGHTSR
jgi:hypothetical protein